VTPLIDPGTAGATGARTRHRGLRLVCVGGGPGGLFAAILAARAGHQVCVFEQQQPAESFGWGVVFWDGLLRQLDHYDPPTASLLRDHAYTWVDQVVQVDDSEPVRIPSSGYSLPRRRLLELLRGRASDLGVRIEPRRYDGDPAALDADLVVASDGVRSRCRASQPGFGTRVERRRNKYIWLGTDREFGSFTFPFVSTTAGWVWGHAYGYAPGASTFVVEMDPQTWTGLGLHTLDAAGTTRRLEQLFEPALQGHRLFASATAGSRDPWTEFSVVRNRRWYVGKVALLGDAAHTTHFTIGSGTRLAMEDAMALADALRDEPDLPSALAAYQRTRQRQLRTMQQVADRSALWFEQGPRYIGRSTDEFAGLMDGRRSPLMAHLPVGAYLALTRTAARLPAVEGPVRRVLSRF
jgi:anthraniloyl-CoA monooxygenase